MHVAIVMPCLNEELLLRDTCASLGFGTDLISAPDWTSLVLVDNGSADRTRCVMRDIARLSRKGAVILANEEERGYVPARHRGVLAARSMAATSGISDRDLLILQADADTRYGDGYVRAMREAARGRTGNFLLEGIANPPAEFEQAWPGFEAFSGRVDAPLEGFFVDHSDDVIVDDKICGYVLADYFAWGGHRREFDRTGEEIFGETSRLYIKAKLAGAHKVRVADAVGLPSRRKILRNPILHFATAGFPREEAWSKAWNDRYRGPNTLDAFGDASAETQLREPIFMRRAHLLILFGLLPVYVAGLLNAKTPADGAETFRELIPMLDLSREQILANTGSLFERAFSLIDSHSELLNTLFAA
jgi:glycosyltransferase involved in cell wall biosynthesis